MRWFMRPGNSRISGCSVPPKATFISWKPRQTPRIGTPRRYARLRPTPGPRRRDARRRAHARRCGSVLNRVGWTLARAPVSNTPSTTSSSASISVISGAPANISGRAPATSATARRFLSPVSLNGEPAFDAMRVADHADDRSLHRLGSHLPARKSRNASSSRPSASSRIGRGVAKLKRSQLSRRPARTAVQGLQRCARGS